MIEIFHPSYSSSPTSRTSPWPTNSHWTPLRHPHRPTRLWPPRLKIRPMGPCAKCPKPKTPWARGVLCLLDSFQVKFQPEGHAGRDTNGGQLGNIHQVYWHVQNIFICIYVYMIIWSYDYICIYNANQVCSWPFSWHLVTREKNDLFNLSESHKMMSVPLNLYVKEWLNVSKQREKLQSARTSFEPSWDPAGTSAETKERFRQGRWSAFPGQQQHALATACDSMRQHAACPIDIFALILIACFNKFQTSKHLQPWLGSWKCVQIIQAPGVAWQARLARLYIYI